MTGVSIAASAVTLTLTSAVTHGQTVEVSYTLPTAVANRLQDAAGNEAAALTDQTVTNNTPDNTVPALSTATPPSVNGASLVLTYDEALDSGSTPAASAFAVTVAGSTRTVSSVDVTGSAVTLTLASAVTAGQAVTVAYTVPTGAGANPIRDEAENNAATFAAQAVTNNTPGIVLSASTLDVVEGGSATYTVRLGSAPTANVTVTVARASGGSTDVTFDTSSAAGLRRTADPPCTVVHRWPAHGSFRR